MMAFREPAQWSFFVIIAFSILIGITSSTVFNKLKRIPLKTLSLILITITLLGSTYPLTIGELTKNPLNTETKGSYFPDTYKEIDEEISSKTWTLLIPKKATYVTYNFDGTALGAGNIYPLVFSKPIISGLGTEYRQSNSELIEYIYSEIAEKNLNIKGKANATASTCESNNKTPNYAIDQDYNTRWASKTGTAQWYQLQWDEEQKINEIEIFFENAYAQDYRIQIWNGTNWITQFEVKDNLSLNKIHTFTESIITTKIRIEFTKLTHYNSVSIYEIEVYTSEAKTENNNLLKSLGVLGIKNLVSEKSIISGNIFDVEHLSILNEDSKEIKVVKEWEEAVLYENKYALEKIYSADITRKYTTINDLFNQTKNTPWTTLQHTTYIQINTTKNTNIPNNLQTPQNLTWQQINPTKYIITTTTNNPFILALKPTTQTESNNKRKHHTRTKPHTNKRIRKRMDNTTNRTTHNNTARIHTTKHLHNSNNSINNPTPTTNNNTKHKTNQKNNKKTPKNKEK